jgi:hypothetical protein
VTSAGLAGTGIPTVVPASVQLRYHLPMHNIFHLKGLFHEVDFKNFDNFVRYFWVSYLALERTMLVLKRPIHLVRQSLKSEALASSLISFYVPCT